MADRLHKPSPLPLDEKYKPAPLMTVAKLFITDWSSHGEHTPETAEKLLKARTNQYLDRPTLRPEEAKELFGNFQSRELRTRMIGNLNNLYTNINVEKVQDGFIKQVCEGAIRAITEKPKPEPKAEPVIEKKVRE